MTFEEWQSKHGPNGGSYDIEMMKAGWDAAISYAAPVLDSVPNNWRDVIAKARQGLAAGSRSISNTDFEVEYGGALIDHIEEQLEGLAAPVVPVAGWVMVPDSPTEEMVHAGWIDKEDVTPADIYCKMLAAAPTPPTTAPVEPESKND